MPPAAIVRDEPVTAKKFRKPIGLQILPEANACRTERGVGRPHFTWGVSVWIQQFRKSKEIS